MSNDSSEATMRTEDVVGGLGTAGSTGTAEGAGTADTLQTGELLIEEISIDGMCGVY